MSSLLTNGVISQDFEPRDFSGLILWFDAQDASTLTLSSNNVTQWNDKSPSANHLSDGLNSNIKPTILGSINGYQAINFSTNANLTTVSNIGISGSQSRDVFTVFKFNSTTAPYTIWWHGTLFFNAATWTPYSPSQTWGISRWGADGRTNTSFSADTPYILETSHDIATGANFDGINIYVDNPETALTWATTSANQTNTGNSRFSIGWYRLQSFILFNGQIGEILYYNRRLTTVERREVFWYLKKKWGL